MNPSIDEPALGVTTTGLAQRHRVASALNAAAIAAAAWGVLWPVPYEVVVPLLAALPWLAVALVTLRGDAFCLETRLHDARPSVACAAAAPGGALIMTKASGAPLDAAPTLALTIFGGLVLTGLLALAVPHIRAVRLALPIYFGLAGCYVYGVGMHANSMFDVAPAEVFRPTVVGKYASEKPPHLKLTAWGPRGDFNELLTPRNVIDAVQPLDTVCIYVHPGALWIPWYVVNRC